MKIPAVWIIILVLFGLNVLQFSCGHKSLPQAVTVKSDTVYKEVVKTIPTYVPKIDTVYRTKTGHVDTAAVIVAFMSKNVTKDTIRNTYGYVLVIDTIYQNQIEDRSVSFDFKVPTVTLTKVIPQKNKVFAGIDLGSNGSFIGIGPQFTLVTKSDKMYWIGGSFTTQGTWFFHAGAAIKLHL